VLLALLSFLFFFSIPFRFRFPFHAMLALSCAATAA